LLRWLSLLLVGCAGSSTGSGMPSLTLLTDECGDLEAGFSDRMAALASSVWQANGGKGAVKYLSFDGPSNWRGLDGICGVSSGLWVNLDVSPGGYTGEVMAVKVHGCLDLDCSVVYRVEKK
jgi:hypothetical protein